MVGARVGGWYWWVGGGLVGGRVGELVEVLVGGGVVATAKNMAIPWQKHRQTRKELVLRSSNRGKTLGENHFIQASMVITAKPWQYRSKSIATKIAIP